MPPLYREEGHPLLFRRGGVCLLSIEKRDTLSLSLSLHQRGGVCLLSIAERDTPSYSERRSMPPLYTEEGHPLLFRDEEYASSL